MNRSYLLDKVFLKELDLNNNKIIHAHIISLDYQEQPIEQIEGVVTAGNISIDGKSAVRRTCSLTVVTDKLNINDVYWGFSTKIKLELGLENHINSFYPDIIWFPQGIFVLNSFATAQNVNSYTITLSGKDKMCLLNGDIGGNFNAETNLGVIDLINIDDEGNQYKITEYQKVKDIIVNMIHHYGQELFSNIIVKDLEKNALNMLDNNSGSAIYWIRDAETEEYKNIFYISDNSSQIIPGDYFFDPDKTERVYYNSASGDTVETKEGFVFQSLIEEDNLWTVTQIEPSYIYNNDGKKFTVVKIENKQPIGYERTDLIYPTDQELIAQPGATVTSILDQLVAFLGEYEYFYNLEGQFVFQAKPIYINTSWNSQVITDNEYYIAPKELVSKVQYGFEGSDIVSALNNQPKINNIKNDYTVWGKRKTPTGIDIPIHARYAIDEKPSIYISRERIDKTYDYLSDSDIEVEIPSYIYVSNIEAYTEMYKWQKDLPEEQKRTIKRVDWREIIYQMAKDYYRYNEKEDFEYYLRKYNTINGKSLFPKGKTGYEQYYHDIEGFWRTLYNPDALYNTELGYYYYTINDATYQYHHITDTANYWNINVQSYPHNLLFWFDFFNGEEINKFSVHAIGSRPKVINEDNVKSIIYQDVPDIIFFDSIEEIEEYRQDPEHLTGYSYIVLPNRDEKYTLSSRGLTAHDKIDSMLYENTYYNASISITSVPVYYLEPNTICYVKNEKSKIDGYYIIEKITIPLTYNGTMSVSAVELPQRIY